MNQQLWPSGSVSVIMLPSGWDGQEVLELAEQWTASWLLTPALWVIDTQVPEKSDGPPEVKAFVLGRDSNGRPDKTEVDLFWALGSQPFRLVRLVAVRSEQDSKDQVSTTQKIRLLSDYLDASKPVMRLEDSSVESGTKLLKLNLVFAKTGEHQSIPQSVIEHGWDANIVAAPEDRPAPGYFDSFVASETRYPGFVLAHIATTAGLWSGLPTSTYELGETHPTLNRARFQRVAVRAVATDKLAGELAKWALDKASSPDNEDSLGRISGQEVATVKATMIPEKINEVVALLLKGQGKDDFLYHGLADNRWLEESPRQLFAKLRIRINDTIDALKYFPKWASAMLNRRLDFDKFEAEEVGYLPTRLDPRFDLKPIDEILNRPRLKVSSVKPELWQLVRETLASAIDSPPSVEVPEPLSGENGKRLIFGDTSSVFPDSTVEWSSGELAQAAGITANTLGWLDVVNTREQFKDIQLIDSEREPGMIEAREEMQQTSLAHKEAVLEEQRAIVELERAEREFLEDVAFAEEMRAEHTHDLPERMVGPSRPSVTKYLEGRRSKHKSMTDGLAESIDDEDQNELGETRG